MAGKLGPCGSATAVELVHRAVLSEWEGAQRVETGACGMLAGQGREGVNGLT